MLKDLFDSLRQSFVEFSVGNLFYLFFIVACVLGGFYIFDQATGYSQYARIDRQINALAKLHALEQKGADRSKALGPVYVDVVKQITRTGRVAPGPTISAWPFLKFLSATFTPLIFALVALPGALRGDANNKSAFLGSGLIVLLLGIPTFWIPNIFGSAALTAGVFFIIQVGVVLYITRKYSKRVAGTA